MGTSLLLVALVTIALLLALGYAMRRRPVIVATAPANDAAPAIVQSSPGTAGDAAASSGVIAVPRGYVRPAPVDSSFDGCVANGDGGDPQLNALKNRADSSGTYYPVTVDAIDALGWPREIERRHRDEWSVAARDAVAQSEGLPISIEGYFAGGKLEGPESPNCHASAPADRDWHLWLSSTPGPDRSRSVVVETTPIVRAMHGEWTLAEVHALAASGERVRVSGWLMLDPEHPDQVGKTRGTIWEIHPVTRIEVETSGGWAPLSAGVTPFVKRMRR